LLRTQYNSSFINDLFIHHSLFCTSVQRRDYYSKLFFDIYSNSVRYIRTQSEFYFFLVYPHKIWEEYEKKDWYRCQILSNRIGVHYKQIPIWRWTICNNRENRSWDKINFHKWCYLNDGCASIAHGASRRK